MTQRIKMKALVTGAAGFIGSHLAEMLLAQGAEVVLVDDLSTGKKANIDALLARGSCVFHQVDIRDRAQLEPCFAGVERVFHLAGRADIVPSIDDPECYFSVNVQGTLNVLQAARPIQSTLSLTELGQVADVAVYDVPRSVEYGLGFYRNHKIASYERNEVPEGDHLVVAAEGSKTELEFRLKGRRVTHIGGYALQHLDFYLVSAATEQPPKSQ